MIEPIQKELEAAILDLRALARDAGPVIPLWSRERWTVQTVNESRSMNQENPIEKDYSKFFFNQLDDLVQRESVKALVSLLQDHPTIQQALCLKADESGIDLIWYYVLPITVSVLKSEDAGNQTRDALANALGLFEAGANEPTYRVKYCAPLLNFTCSEDELYLTDGISVRRIPNNEMAQHLNALCNVDNFGQFHDVEFQLESVQHRERISPRLAALTHEVQNLFWEMAEALRLLKVGAVGIFFNRAQAFGFWGPGESAASYSVGLRLYGDKNSFKYKLSKEDVPNLMGVYKALKELRKNARFSIALRRFTSSYNKPMGDDRVLDYWIALESLILPDGKDGELTFKSAIRIAYLLGDKSTRTELFKNVRASYRLRSNIAHGEKPSVQEKDVSFLENVVRRTMLHFLTQKAVPDPEWLNSLVLDVLPE